MSRRESGKTSRWQLGSSDPPPTVSLGCSRDLGGERRTAPHWRRVSTAAEVQEVPLTVQCTIHSAVKLKTTEPLDCPESEKCARHISLKWWACMVGGGGWHSCACSWISKKKKKKKKHPAWAVGVCVCVGERVTWLEENKGLEWFLGRRNLLMAERRMFGPADNYFRGLHFDVMEN